MASRTRGWSFEKDESLSEDMVNVIEELNGKKLKGSTKRGGQYMECKIKKLGVACVITPTFC